MPTFVDASPIGFTDHTSDFITGVNENDWTFTAADIPGLAEGDVLLLMIASIDNDTGASPFPAPSDPTMASAPADWSHDATAGWSFPGSPHPTAYSRWELYSKVWGPDDDADTYVADWISSLPGYVTLDEDGSRINVIVQGNLLLHIEGGVDRTFEWSDSLVGVDGVHDYPYDDGIVTYSSVAADSAYTPSYYPGEFDLAQARYTVHSSDPYEVYLAQDAIVGTFPDGSFSGGDEVAQGLPTFHYFYVTHPTAPPPTVIRASHNIQRGRRLGVS